MRLEKRPQTHGKTTASARSGLNAGSPLPSHAQLPAIPRRIDAQRPNQGPHQTCFGRRKPVFAVREPCGHTVAPGTALSDVPALSPPSNLVLAAHQNRGFRTAIPSVWRTLHTACQNRRKTFGTGRTHGGSGSRSLAIMGGLAQRAGVPGGAFGLLWRLARQSPFRRRRAADAAAGFRTTGQGFHRLLSTRTADRSPVDCRALLLRDAA